MKKLAPLAMLLSLGLFTLGCTDEQQLENAQDNLQEEQMETQETMNDASRDGVLTGDEAADVHEEQGETIEAAGEVAEQQGELIDSETDN